jgi:hypothetical protein
MFAIRILTSGNDEQSGGGEIRQGEDLMKQGGIPSGILWTQLLAVRNWQTVGLLSQHASTKMETHDSMVMRSAQTGRISEISAPPVHYLLTKGVLQGRRSDNSDHKRWPRNVKFPACIGKVGGCSVLLKGWSISKRFVNL